MHHNKSVLITDGVHPVLFKHLESAGYHCEYRPEIHTNEVNQIIAEYTGIIINSKITVDKVMLDKAVRLKFIGRLGSGLEIIDLSYAAEKGVAVYNSPEGNRNAVAEHALGMLLALANNFLQADAQVRQKVWQREANRGFEIMGQTVGIIGFGHTGSTFATKLAGMGVRVLAYDKYKLRYTNHHPYVEETDMETIFREADIISLHLPLTAETRHLVNLDFIKKFAKKIIIINTSRGKVVKITDLIAGLESGKVRGACLDVFENEKPQTLNENENDVYEKLYKFDNVILTPHVAGWTAESKRRLAEVLAEKIISSGEYASSE